MDDPADDQAQAVRRAARVVDVPGAPLSLRLDDVSRTREGARLDWSFVDPESHAGDPHPHGRRIRGSTQVPSPRAPSEDLARDWWAAAQLAAAHRFKEQVDSDAMPGVPYVHRTWSVEEAWEALVAYLGPHCTEVRPEDGIIRVDDGYEQTTFLIDPTEWAAYLSDVEPTAVDEHPDDATEAHLATGIVPTAVPLVDGLPLWAVDELEEATGSGGPVIALVEGELAEGELAEGELVDGDPQDL
ncbi:hypothetical protein [Nocardioides pacificus]